MWPICRYNSGQQANHARFAKVTKISPPLATLPYVLWWMETYVTKMMFIEGKVASFSFDGANYPSRRYTVGPFQERISQ